ncbi:GTP 3',8-cyclase MoaA [Bradyrhizobium sp. I71]|uniref:GTP 3',8-cyclase MoaA n=1 Tax=Bradyrhizobium sp. I71 TaxID=2590772 RepID=UPI001EF7B221|nr:GTP 3',8-cyclase MoaA [Bradyrhizobium sp. I71]ULK98516.1 GTP 3',8-cyclase MoaA [Bradyrhizobium sp. I71]
MMIDPYSRVINYVRVSVTDRCDCRCIYCMSEDMTFLPKKDVLTLDELDRLCSTLVRLGTTKLRITGGEPLVRTSIMELFRRLGRHLQSGMLRELTLTTNGTQLSRYADELRSAGVKRINVSLDSLDADKFKAITRWGKLKSVLDGLNAAKSAGLIIKINTVALKGVNDDEHNDLVAWCGEQGFDLAFIEVMPMGDLMGPNRVDQFMPLTLVRSRLAERWTLEDSDYRSGGPARYVHVAETGRRVGFITPLTHNFCESCNRVRVTCTGTMFMCLGQEDSADLRTPLRTSSDDVLLEHAIRNAIARKPKGHDFKIERGRSEVAVGRLMNVTGG